MVSPLVDPVDVLLASLGEELRQLRLKRNIEQRTGSPGGHQPQSPLKTSRTDEDQIFDSSATLMLALGREDWIKAIAPLPKGSTRSCSPEALIGGNGSEGMPILWLSRTLASGM